MTQTFVEMIVDLVQRPLVLNKSERDQVVDAFEDTMAVVHAGWHEPVSVAVRQTYGVTTVWPDARHPAEISALVLGAAAHSLDYDDVELVSVTHPSVVLVSALLALGASDPALRSRMAPAYAVGLSVMVALGRALGFGHYALGWHATSTLGPIAGAAALSHMLALSETQTRSALALGASMSGGLQRNFGSMAKPVQAGNAAAGAVRAAQLAIHGVTGDVDIFGLKGFFDLFGGASDQDGPQTLAPQAGGVSRKLFPCCYAAHRLVQAALDARARMSASVDLSQARVEVAVPFGTMTPLRVLDPADGAGGKFCAAYAVAVALLRGRVGLDDFSDAAVLDPEVRSLMDRIVIEEPKLVGEMPIGLEHGEVHLRITIGGRTVEARCACFPGSPAAPATPAQIDTKIIDCLSAYNRSTDEHLSPSEFRALVAESLGV